MKIAIVSAHRSNIPAHPRYFAQVASLRTALSLVGHHVRVIAVEGDSNDHGRTQRSIHINCEDNSLDYQLITCNHGGPHFGSTESPVRLAALSKVGNACLDSITVNDDIVIYVESDLIWTGTAMWRLITTLMSNPNEVDIVAPLVFAGDCFYDVLLFRGLDGARFSPFPPYHPTLLPPPALTRVASAGSCLVMGSAIARDPRHRMTSNALLDFCAAVTANKHKIYVDTSVRINHP